MTDYEVGYKKTPVHTRFKPGVSPHPAGRPMRKPDAAAEIVENFRNEKITYRENGRKVTTTRAEYEIKKLFHKALTGDVKAAQRLLDLRVQAERRGERSNVKFRVRGWLRDSKEQTAEQKNQEFAARAAQMEEARRDDTG